MEFTNEDIMAGRLAYEQDRREHEKSHWQPHWEEISHGDRIHWIIMTRGKQVNPQAPAPAGAVVVIR